MEKRKRETFLCFGYLTVLNLVYVIYMCSPTYACHIFYFRHKNTGLADNRKKKMTERSTLYIEKIAKGAY
jgi:hypothetical protein